MLQLLKGLGVIKIDLTGMTFGRLIVIGRSNDDYINLSTKKHTRRWICECSCGNKTTVTTPQLTGGRTKSCGCLQRERTAQANTKHGGRYDRLHSVWANMKNRCYNPNYSEYESYGGRGITVCDEWQNYPSFAEWATNAGYNKYLKRGECTLDRIDVNGNYCPQNCRFVNMYIQANNKMNNVYITHNGESHTIADWSKKLGVKYNSLYYRIKTKGLSLENAIKEIL